MRFLVTGGCGFIGSAVVRTLIARADHVLNVDSLTYAGDPRTVAEVTQHPNYRFERQDIVDVEAIRRLVADFAPDAIIHLAAESHVDRSIDNPRAFIDTNLVGTFSMLEAALGYWSGLQTEAREGFRFVHVSTDEVFGSLGENGFFIESSSYRPNSPYAASKAGADHLVRAWHKTYALPVLISNCSNNYGPFQNREKLIPTVIRKSLLNQSIPIYGTGNNVRDWIYVDDHVAALLKIHENGVVGESYNVGAESEISNILLAKTICTILDTLQPRFDGRSYSENIRLISDRPGHDFRYAINSSKIAEQLGWAAKESLDAGLLKTIQWYLDRMDWTLESSKEDDRLGLNVSKP